VLLHLRKSIEQLDPLRPAQKEPENVADVAPLPPPGSPQQLQAAPLAEARHDEDRLAFQESPVGADISKLMEQQLWRHSDLQLQDPGRLEINNQRGRNTLSQQEAQ
jgi:hypothetical protein